MGHKSHCYFPSPRDDEKRKRAIAKAVNRANIMKEWMDKGNKLTITTQPELHRLLKQADKEFDKRNK